MSTPPSLLPLEQALDILIDQTQTSLETENISLDQVRGRVSAEALASKTTQPPFDNSAVDGYALRAADYIEGETLPVGLRVAAGDAPLNLPHACAARIFTGAPVPKGADCVVMQEDTEITTEGECQRVKIQGPVRSGSNIRPAGQDFALGQRILKPGEVISPQRIGLLAAAGISSVSVFKPLSVAILATGDELVEPGKPLQPGQIYDSNSWMLCAMLESLGMNVVNIGNVPDSFEATVQALQKASQYDVIITCGGASVGDEDHVRKAIGSLGSVDFWRIALKPGKPFMYGQISDTPVLGLPGNPSAVLVTFLILARPLLLKRQGCASHSLHSQWLPLDQPIEKAGRRREFLRVRIGATQTLVQHPNQSSGMLSSACWADGFAIVPENTAPQAGDRVEFVSLTSLLQLPESTLEIE